ncbi:MAG: hypothetical protein JAY64_12655, partial [Candidatus Thiodiazotropha weberae]|nr:hypothetical protein [Candidatus Thiodiazotropha lotti]MCW4212004.1 hypothetical protein [Candidatus Thiodiazotropha lotti]
TEQVMNRHLVAKMHRFCVADLRNSGLYRAICALVRQLLIDNLFGSDLFRGSLRFAYKIHRREDCRYYIFVKEIRQEIAYSSYIGLRDEEQAS